MEAIEATIASSVYDIGIEDSRTPMVTAPVALILSKVALDAIALLCANQR
jgi:hypothetical protein